MTETMALTQPPPVRSWCTSPVLKKLQPGDWPQTPTPLGSVFTPATPEAAKKIGNGRQKTTPEVESLRAPRSCIAGAES